MIRARVVSLSNGSTTGVLFHRRERPDLLFDKATGNPLAFFSALQETAQPVGKSFGWSFSFAQAVKGSKADGLEDV